MPLSATPRFLRRCPMCSKDFLPKTNATHYCSTECQGKAHSNSVCVLCNKVFERLAHQLYFIVCCCACTGREHASVPCSSERSLQLKEAVPAAPEADVPSVAAGESTALTQERPLSEAERVLQELGFGAEAKAEIEPSPPPAPRTCRACTRDFVPRQANQERCSSMCRGRKSRGEWPQRLCSVCDEPFLPLASDQTMCFSPCGNPSIGRSPSLLEKARQLIFEKKLPGGHLPPWQRPKGITVELPDGTRQVLPTREFKARYGGPRMEPEA